MRQLLKSSRARCRAQHLCRCPTTTTQGSVDTNPKISVIGDFVWNINHNKKLDGGDPFNIRELELGFQDNIDPWSKADVYLALEKEEDGKYSIDPEEAYVTLSKMPFRTQMRIGRWLLPFGKDNPTHTHAKPYVDQPDVITNFMGPDGMKGTGMEVSACSSYRQALH